MVTASRTTATAASASTERRSPERSGSASRIRFFFVAVRTARWRASWAARSGSASGSCAGAAASSVPVPSAPVSSASREAEAVTAGSVSRPVQRRENHATASITPISATLTISSCPYRVPVSADQEPTCRQDW